MASASSKASGVQLGCLPPVRPTHPPFQERVVAAEVRAARAEGLPRRRDALPVALGAEGQRLVEGQPSRQRELLKNLGHAPPHQSIQCVLDEQIMKEI